MDGRSGDSSWQGAVLTCNRAGVWEFKQLDGIGIVEPASPLACPERRTEDVQRRTLPPGTPPPYRGPAVWDDTPFDARSDGPIAALEAEPLDGYVIGLGVGLRRQSTTTTTTSTDAAGVEDERWWLEAG